MSNTSTHGSKRVVSALWRCPPHPRHPSRYHLDADKGRFEVSLVQFIGRVVLPKIFLPFPNLHGGMRKFMDGWPSVGWCRMAGAVMCEIPH